MVAVWLKFCFFCFSWQNTVRYLNYLRTSLVLTFVEPSAGCTWSKTQSSSRRDDNEAGPQGEGKAPCWIKRRVWPVSHNKLIGQSIMVFLPLIYLKEFTLSPYRGMWERQRASLQIWRSGFGSSQRLRTSEYWDNCVMNWHWPTLGSTCFQHG